jgi:hypothetical protein
MSVGEFNGNDTSVDRSIPFKVAPMANGGSAALRAVNPSDEVTDKLLAYQDKFLAVAKNGQIGVLMVYITHSLPGGRKNVVRVDFRSTTMGQAPKEVQTLIDGLEFVPE